MENKTLKETVIEYSKDPRNADLNFNMGYKYQELNQGASAFSHYLRAAEEGDDLLAYESLIRAQYSIVSQKDRGYTEKYLLKQCIVILPERPEAYYLMAKHYMKRNDHADAYFHFKMAEKLCDFTLPETQPLRTKIGYKNNIHFYIDFATCAWKWDKNEEARTILRMLMKDEIYNSADEEDKKYIRDSIEEVGILGGDTSYTYYKKDLYPKLKYTFEGCENIETNFSQVYQDMFILFMHKGKKNGTFVEVGCGPAVRGSNTYLLESKYNWKGISIDKDPEFAAEQQHRRKSTTIFDDALTIDYESLIAKHLPDVTEIDYLQLDLEPAKNTFECLLSIPFEKYKFGVITYEHDHYIDFTKSYRSKSRRYLTLMGYELA